MDLCYYADVRRGLLVDDDGASAGAGAVPPLSRDLFYVRGVEMILPLLGPVGSDDAAGWLADQFEDTVSVEWKAAKAEIEQLFKPKAASKHGVPMKAFVEAVGPLFRKSV